MTGCARERHLDAARRKHGVSGFIETPEIGRAGNETASQPPERDTRRHSSSAPGHRHRALPWQRMSRTGAAACGFDRAAGALCPGSKFYDNAMNKFDNHTID